MKAVENGFEENHDAFRMEVEENHDDLPPSVMRWRQAGALVVRAFNLVTGFPGGWVQYIRIPDGGQAAL